LAFDVGSVVAHIKADLTGFREGMAEAKNTVNGVGDSIGKMSSGLASFGKQTALFTTVVGAGLVFFGKQSVDASNEAEAAQAKLRHAVIGVTKATEDQLKETENLAIAIQNKGVLDDDNIKTGLAQLSTFGLSNEAVQGLGQSLADLSVNQFGVKASGEQMGDAANMMAKALRGSFGILEKSGIRFTEAQKAIIMTGTEMEKVSAINEGFQQNLKYTNEVALTTTEGKLAAVSVQWGNFKERIGDVIKGLITFVATGDSTVGLLKGIGMDEDDPRLQGLFKLRDAFVKIGKWISENKDLVLTFLTGFAIGLSALLIIGTITMLITAMTNPLFLVVVAITALYTAFQTNFMGIRDIFNAFVPYLQATWQIIIGIFQLAWAIIAGIFTTAIALLKGDWSGAWEAIKKSASDGWDGIVKIFNGAIIFIKGWGGSIINALVSPFENAWNKISSFVNKIKNALDFTQRNSPSVLDIVKSGVRQVNDALTDIMVVPTMGAPAIAGAVGAGASSISNLQLVVNMDGAIIADEFSANSIAEKLGNQIIRKLRTQVRF